MMWVLADSYGWIPDVIDELYMDDAQFWLAGVGWINKQKNGK